MKSSDCQSDFIGEPAASHNVRTTVWHAAMQSYLLLPVSVAHAEGGVTGTQYDK